MVGSARVDPAPMRALSGLARGRSCRAITPACQLAATQVSMFGQDPTGSAPNAYAQAHLGQAIHSTNFIVGQARIPYALRELAQSINLAVGRASVASRLG